ncbi:ATP-binding protein [Microbulbifer sp. S227A]|uniref:hybrid sensor histidine kinase/response regulator n=1 Tax=Microbulbifer sp. S227A TaxID=3415131 RepID=UPI003C7CC3A0
MPLRRLPLRIQYVGMVSLVVLGMAVSVYLSLNVVRDLRLLDAAQSDNVQWSLSQAEVEALRYQQAVGKSLDDPGADLQDLRRAFDIFYSRINTIKTASIYATLREDDMLARDLAVVRGFLDDTIPLIDGSDETLRWALPGLEAEVAELPVLVRAMSTRGLKYFAEWADEQRETVSRTLLQLGAAVAVLMLTLIFLALNLGSLNRANVRRRRQVKEASQRMEVVIDTALDAVIVSDINGQVLEFNAAAEQIFGYDAGYAIGRSLEQLIIPDKYRDAHVAGMKRMREKGEKRVVGKGRIRLEGRRANGEVFPLEFAIQTAETRNGQLFVAFLRDITGLVEAENELVAARDQALANERAKTEFLATMSHEIRTPLNGLLGNLSLLEETRLGERQQLYVQNMNTSGELLLRHVSDVLDITKYDAGKLQLHLAPMNLGKLVQDIIDNQGGAAAANGTDLSWGWDGAAQDWIVSDSDRLQHVLMNIIGNAVKFTRAGRVRVDLHLADNAPLLSELRIEVRDTGIGMSDELRARIFDDFTTGDSSYDRAVGGTGLGLGIAKRFVDAMKGEIEVDSRRGEGSRFTIRLPVQTIDPPEDATPVEPAQTERVTGARILLVEDNAINRFVAGEMLAAGGHTVEEAHDGQQAVEMAARSRYDLILMDISMPVMDGRTATRTIRGGAGLSSGVPIVALTANAMESEQKAFIADGMNDVLIKPLSRDTMLRVISDQVGPFFGGGAEPGPQDDAGAVDLSYIDDLRETLGAEAVNRLLTSFATEAQGLLDWLADAATLPLDEIGQRTHAIAGNAAMLGTQELHAALLNLENAAKAGDRADVIDGCGDLQEAWERTRPALT